MRPSLTSTKGMASLASGFFCHSFRAAFFYDAIDKRFRRSQIFPGIEEILEFVWRELVFHGFVLDEHLSQLALFALRLAASCFHEFMCVRAANLGGKRHA